MSFKKSSDLPMNSKRLFEENEAKIKFMNYKSQNLIFFNDNLPHYEEEDDSNKANLAEIGNCPTKKLNFFNGVNSFKRDNQEKNFNSYLFQSK